MAAKDAFSVGGMADERRILREEAITYLRMSQETEDERESLRFVLLALKCLERFLDLEEREPKKPALSN